MSSSDDDTPGAEGRGRLRGWHSKPAPIPLSASTRRITLDPSGPPLLLPSLPTEPRRVPAHDAWAVDHVRRSTPAPMPIEPGLLDQGLEGILRAAAERVLSANATRAEESTPNPGTALDLVEQSKPSWSGIDLPAEMADRFALGDFSGALGVAELILGTNPADVAAQRYADASREKLELLYASRLGSTRSVLEVAVRESDIRWLGLDHRAGFLLSRVDGHSTIDEILDTSGMPRLEALRTLSELLDQRALAIRSTEAQRRRP